MRDAFGVVGGYYEGSGRCFEEDLEGCARCEGAVVLVCEGCVFLGRPVRWGVGVEVMGDFGVRFDVEGCDAFFVFLLCGDLRFAVGALGGLARFKRVCFVRGRRDGRADGGLRVLPMKRVLALAGYYDDEKNRR